MLLTFDGFDDSTYQASLWMSPFDAVSPFTAYSVVTSAFHIPATRFLERNDCKFCVALQCDLAMTRQNQ